MNLLKESLFSPFKSASKARSRQSSQNQLKNYRFRQATSSAVDPLLYTFDNDQIELDTLNSDEESTPNDEQHLRPRQFKRPTASASGPIVIVEKAVLQDESIQAFAIRCRVSVSTIESGQSTFVLSFQVAQLKRLNNLQNDHDFYALSQCRVPVPRFGLLDDSATLVDLTEPSIASIPVTHLSQKNHHAFLSAMDQDLASVRTKVEEFIERPSTTASLISQSTPTREEVTAPAVNKSNEWSCDGADCGCRVWQIVMVLILIALIPLVYVYFYLKSRHSNKLWSCFLLISCYLLHFWSCARVDTHLWIIDCSLSTHSTITEQQLVMNEQQDKCSMLKDDWDWMSYW